MSRQHPTAEAVAHIYLCFEFYGRAQQGKDLHLEIILWYMKAIKEVWKWKLQNHSDSKVLWKTLNIVKNIVTLNQCSLAVKTC